MCTHPAARALTGYLLVRGGVHQVAYARAIELLTGADLMKMFPAPRIPTDKIPECQPHIARGDHLRLYRFSPDDYLELGAVFRGPHPETKEQLEVIDSPPEGAPAHDLPPQPAVFGARLRTRGHRRDRRPAARQRGAAERADRNGREHERRRPQGPCEEHEEEARREEGRPQVTRRPAGRDVYAGDMSCRRPGGRWPEAEDAASRRALGSANSHARRGRRGPPCPGRVPTHRLANLPADRTIRGATSA